MRWSRALVIALCGCATGGGDAQRVPLCGPLETLAPRPETCAPEELGEFSNALSDRAQIAGHASSGLVRVELDEAARVRAVCVEPGPGYGPSNSRRAIARNLDSIHALAPGPACAAGKRIDLNRYEAALAKVSEREDRCAQQTGITRETHGDTTVRGRRAGGAYGVYERELERCMEHEADWITLDAPGSTRPWIYVKPEVPDPGGPSASDTTSRCGRKSRVFEKQVACIESEGWERLEPPSRRADSPKP
jgi:hypothetical protein